MNFDLMTTDGVVNLIDALQSELDQRHVQARAKQQIYAAAAAVDLDMTGLLRDQNAATDRVANSWTATRTTPPHPAQPNFTAAELMDIIGGGLKGCPEKEEWPTRTVDPLLAERGRGYGEFPNVARTAGEIRGAIDRACGGRPGDRLSAVQLEAIIMVATKLARIANGNPANVDSWRDIAGYATLVVRDLEA